jgi:hypothetical protein
VDAFHFDWVHLNTSFSHNHAKVFNVSLFKDTLFWFQEEVMVLQFLEDTADQSTVEFKVIIGGNDNVVHVDEQPPFYCFFSEDVIHHCLEGGWRICQSKEHDHWFKQPFAGFEGGFVFISFFQMDVVVSPVNVELSEQPVFGNVWY